MLRLALETSTRLGSVALAEGDEVLCETLLPVWSSHSETVLPEVERLLEAAERSVDDLSAVVVGAGPGSFTGVRIAASIAKGLCFARGVPLFAYSSLAAVAAASGLETPLCAVFDARRGEVYAAAFRDGNLTTPELGPLAATLGDLLRRLGDPSAWAFTGEGAVRHADRFLAAGGRVLPPHLGLPRATALLWLARRWPEAGRVGDVAGWEPGYLRRPGAERDG